MKKTILIAIAFLICGIAWPQKGEIIYTEFEPDSIVHYCFVENQPNLPLNLDLNQDGVIESRFTCEESVHFMLDAVLRCDPEWRFRLPYQIYHIDNAVPIVGDTIQIGDTIPNIEGSWTRAYRFKYNRYNYQYPYQQVCPAPDSHYYISVKHEVEGGYCYGWIDSHIFISEDPVINGSFDGQEIYITIFSMAYCTIPNYPLRVGQTSFTWNLEENESAASATLHPNPTNGLVTITGENLRQAEMFNLLGQRVAEVQCEGNPMTVDISGLPAGLYFVNVTDEQGRKCVRKVVKE